MVCGGKQPSAPELSAGYFLEPTIFDGVRPEMRIAQEEIFGPVMSVMVWSDFEEMLAMANGVPYGLTAAIVTADLAGAMETAHRIDAGYVWVNSNGRYLGAPYGGWKLSGIGQEESLDELLSYTRVKNINLRW
jgi:betaine-aldehyde dehydrogenase